jgi:hypothetical protein
MTGNKSTTADKRTRSYATIVYPDSAPENWIDILTQFHISAFISPLHDKDINPTGEPKKPHYHVLLMFEGKKSVPQALEVFEAFGGVGCEIVNSQRGYARYLCHLDNPEKAQYSTEDVKQLCGADYSSVINLAIDKYKALGEMEDFCDKYDIVSFYLLTKYARNNRPDWYRILCDCGTVFMREFLNSRKWSKEQNYTEIVDPETGEVIM